jgi:hypothetical protein
METSYIKKLLKKILSNLQNTDYQTFIVLDSGEDIPTGYQKIAYHMTFDVKYDLRHEASLVEGGNLTVNDKKDIFKGYPDGHSLSIYSPYFPILMF